MTQASSWTAGDLIHLVSTANAKLDNEDAYMGVA